MCWHVKPYVESWRRTIQASVQGVIFVPKAKEKVKTGDDGSIFKTSFCKVGQLLWLIFFFATILFHFLPSNQKVNKWLRFRLVIHPGIS